MQSSSFDDSTLVVGQNFAQPSQSPLPRDEARSHLPKFYAKNMLDCHHDEDSKELAYPRCQLITNAACNRTVVTMHIVACFDEDTWNVLVRHWHLCKPVTLICIIYTPFHNSSSYLRRPHREDQCRFCKLAGYSTSQIGLHFAPRLFSVSPEEQNNK